MGDVHHCSRAPISEMTYTVSSGTLNSTIPCHTIRNVEILVQRRWVCDIVSLWCSVHVNSWLCILHGAADLCFVLCNVSTHFLLSSQVSCHMLLQTADQSTYYVLVSWTSKASSRVLDMIVFCAMYVVQTVVHHIDVWTELLFSTKYMIIHRLQNTKLLVLELGARWTLQKLPLHLV